MLNKLMTQPHSISSAAARRLAHPTFNRVQRPYDRVQRPFRRFAFVEGFTLVELLVVIAIIGVLVGMALPAMQNMRELSRRNLCEQKLGGVSLALSAYSLRFTRYPSGTINDSGPIRSEEEGYHHNWLGSLMPMLDAENVAAAIDSSVGVYDSANDTVRSLALPMLRCPSATGVAANTSSYAGISSSTETPIDKDNDGMFFLNSRVNDDDITDGLAYTVFVAEKISRASDDLGWISGTRSSLRTTGIGINIENRRIRGPQTPDTVVDELYVGGISSDHPGGAYVLLGSGAVQYRSDTSDLQVLQQMASRADGAIPTSWQTTIISETKTESASSKTGDDVATDATAGDDAATADDSRTAKPDSSSQEQE